LRISASGEASASIMIFSSQLKTLSGSLSPRFRAASARPSAARAVGGRRFRTKLLHELGDFRQALGREIESGVADVFAGARRLEFVRWRWVKRKDAESSLERRG